MKINIGLTEKALKHNSTQLSILLADEYLLYTKTRNYHWNVTGANFQELHKFFEEQYTILDAQIDEIAERVRMLGNTPAASLKDFLKLTRLKEASVQGAQEMLQSLLKDHEHIIKDLRTDIKATSDNEDVGTSDFLTALMEAHEKMAWMLRAYIEI